MYSIRDMGSLNGTIVNGHRISKEKCVSSWERLNGGDHVLLGKTKLAVFFSVKLPDLPLSREEQGNSSCVRLFHLFLLITNLSYLY